MNNFEIPPQIRDEVSKRINALESQHNISVLLAIESGSRAWGFASTDSDYDVRMIYLHKPEWYWSIEDEFIDVESRGAINIPINDDLDIAGWDLKKTLGLLYKSNPPLFEWLRSPIVYQRDQGIADDLLKLSERFYSQKSSVYHYLHMAQGNFRQYLVNREEVKRKKYLYVVRPILACRWIEQFQTFPPMEIDKTLVTISDHPVKSAIIRLISEKKAGAELGLGPADKDLETFLADEIERLNKSVANLPNHKREMAELNTYFRTTLTTRFYK